MKKLLLTAFTTYFAITATYAQHIPSSPALDSLRNEKDPVALQKKLDQLGKGNEQELSLLIDYYFITGNEPKADSMIGITVKKYPSGTTAYNKYQHDLFTTRGGKNQEELFLANKGKFANSDHDTEYFSIAYAYAMDKDLKKMNEYKKKIRDTFLRSACTVRIAGAVMNYDPKEAEKLARPEVEALYKKGTPKTTNPAGHPDKDTRNYFEAMELFAAILAKNGKNEEAYKYAKTAYDGSTYRADQLKSLYAVILNKTGRDKEAFSMLYDLVSSGKGTDELKTALKESFSKLNPGKDPAAYMAQVEKDMKARIEEELKKTVVSEDAPNFYVKDVNGNTVSLADFKGKTIVLDFWATWCGPCKASFPAMQRVVNAYKDNPNVKVLFIHTWENAADPLKAAKAYLTSNKYNFDLYMDTKDPKTNTCPAVTAFGVKGIPAKFVIDGNGKIRFKKTGFDGADDAAVAEMGAMIDMAGKQ